jgi:hypothetical protein
MMNHPREKWDLLWELMEVSALLGKESERLPTQPTIENYQKAFEKRQEVLGKAIELFEVFSYEEKVKNG